MHALVTGHDGFIGTHLLAALRQRGDRIAFSDSLANADTDIGRAKPDVVYHLAAQTSVPKSIVDPARDAELNIIGTIRVLEGASSVGAHVVFASTAAAILPLSPYGIGKLAAELYCDWANVPVAVLRIANVYGPGSRGVIATFLGHAERGETATVYGDGEQTRDYIHVSDVVRAMTHAADRRAIGVFQVGTGVETSVLELAAMLQVPVQLAQAQPNELRHSCLPPSLPGWHSTVDLHEALDVRGSVRIPGAGKS